MNLLFFSTCYPHSAAPVRGTYNYELCQALRTFARVRVVSPRPWPEVIRTWRSRSEEKVQRGSIRTTYPCFLYPPKVMRHQYGQFMWKSVRRQVERIFADLATDWVLSYWAHPDGEAGLEAARACGAKAGVIVGGSDVLILTKNAQRRNRVQRVLRDSDAVFTVSEGLRRHVIAMGIEAEKVHTVYQGINESVFKPGFKSLARRRLRIPLSDRVFLWVGRLVSVKRLSLLVEAFGQVRQSEPAAKLILAGEGPLLGETRRAVEEAGLADSVSFPGAIPQAELPDWYRAADATVLSSASEGLPNVFRESLACGTPFVSTDVGSVSEIAAPDYSLLACSGDAESLARAMREILNVRFQLAAQQYTARSWIDCAGEMTDLLTGVSSSSASDSDMARDQLIEAEGESGELLTATST